MVKKFISRTKKFKRRRTSTLRRRSSYSVARIGLNTMGTRFFPALPQRLQLKVPFYADTKMNTNIFTAAQNSNGGGYTNCFYWFIDPLDMSRDQLSLGHQASTKFYSAALPKLLTLYAEGQYRTHHLSMELTGEYFRQIGSTTATTNETYTQAEPNIHFACAPVSLTYLRNSVGSQHVITDAGTIYSGVDYYSALTQMPGSKSFLIPTSGQRTPIRTSMIIDGFAHDGTSQSVRSTITWSPQTAGNPPSIPTPVITYPNIQLRNVYLFAVRVRGIYYANVIQTASVRMSLNLEQHMTFIDPYPQYPYSTDGTA